MRAILPALAATALLASAASAQTMTGYSVTNAAGETATVFSVQPTANIAAPDYVKMSADALNYRVAAAQLAVTKAERADVRTFAKAQLAGAERERGALYAALNNKDRKIARPSSMLSSDRQASLDLLKKAPRGSFDNLYLTQLTDGAPNVWALQKGYATTGADPVLRQVATVSVPSIERGYTSAKGLMPAALTN